MGDTYDARMITGGLNSIASALNRVAAAVREKPQPRPVVVVMTSGDLTPEEYQRMAQLLSDAFNQTETA